MGRQVAAAGFGRSWFGREVGSRTALLVVLGGVMTFNGMGVTPLTRTDRRETARARAAQKHKREDAAGPARMDTEPYGLSDDWLRFGAFESSASRREIRRDGRLVDIGQRGQNLLQLLLAHAGQPVSKARLIQAAWGARVVEQSNLTVQIALLRRHLGAARDDPAEAEPLIRTVPGFGYVFAGSVTRDRGATEEAHPPVASAAPATDGAWLTEPLTMFVGREKERRTLAELLSTRRLVTLTGMGGVGKTRLALRLRQELAPRYRDGVTLVDLAPLVEARQVDEAVAAALGAGGDEPEARAASVAALQDRQLLLLLDNAEHLGAAVGRLLGHILARCPSVSALVTSRECLGVPGEVVFRLSPLDLPPDRDGLTAAEALGFDSVRLLVDRAQALLPGFTLGDAAAPHAAEICRRLDGIALAIEMAVPRLVVLSLRQLAERMQDRFRAVAGLRHDAPRRQRTLRAMFDWSWELLSAEERRLLQLLAISAAGTTLGALEALAAADGLAGRSANIDILHALTRLAQSSLVVVTVPARSDGEPRYRLLETTRQHALEQLQPAARAALSRIHAQTVAARFECACAEWPAMHSAAWLDRYGPDTDNLRASMQWAFSQPDAGELALRLAAASFSLWWELPSLPLREARSWYALALARVGPQTPPVIEARLWLGQSWTDTVDGDLHNYPAVDRAMRLFRAADDPIGLSAALWRAASTVLLRDHTPSAPVLLAEALDVLARKPAPKWLALCHVREADLLQAEGALLAALAKYDRALATVRALGYAYGLMVCGGNRAYTLFALGRQAEAIAFLRDLRLELPPGFRHPSLSVLAIMLAASGQDAAARAAALEGLGDTVTIGMTSTLARSIEALALAVARSGDIGMAGRFLGFALAHHPFERARLGPRRAVLDQLLLILDDALTVAERERLLAEGASWTEGEAVAAATGAG